MLKNRYYKIILKYKKEIIIRVKKDFYTEGIIINENKLLQGYFDFYYSIYLNILDNNDTKSKIDYHQGIIGYLNELSYTYLDENLEEALILHNSNKIKANFVEIINKELMKNIDFLIRNNIRKLNLNNKQIYDYFNERRLSHYKNLKSEITTPIYNIDGTKYIAIDDNKLNFTRENLLEIEQYLQSLNKEQIIKKKQLIKCFVHLQQ